jgi:hypothetical protein
VKKVAAALRSVPTCKLSTVPDDYPRRRSKPESKSEQGKVSNALQNSALADIAIYGASSDEEMNEDEERRKNGGEEEEEGEEMNEEMDEDEERRKNGGEEKDTDDSKNRSGHSSDSSTNCNSSRFPTRASTLVCGNSYAEEGSSNSGNEGHCDHSSESENDELPWIEEDVSEQTVPTFESIFLIKIFKKTS